ncbi:hypothetical protein CUMW_228030 [Citrus unshiu]|uniref:Uncharacterized protein n=1 Tax=Citrus unshiu TaxID=55188 RepID=A0A2H5QGI4_CITUN|nr:hypothetical protein CUMW_228030 [Citrus unshiu]
MDSKFSNCLFSSASKIALRFTHSRKPTTSNFKKKNRNNSLVAVKD